MRFPRSRLVGWLALACLTFLGMLKAAAATSDYLIDSWTSDDDLPDTSVTALAQTPDGYLWVGTYNGLARFDGVRFVTFDPLNTPALQRARVNALFVDRQGTLWINTYDGSMISWRAGVFTLEWRGGLVSKLFTRTNELIFALDSGAFVSRSNSSGRADKWQNVKLAGPAKRNCFQQDAAGALWYLLKDGQVGRIIGTNTEVLSDDAAYGLKPARANHLTMDNRGRIWVATDRGIAVWNGRRFDDRTPTNGEPVVNATFMAFTASNACWVFADGKVRQRNDRRWIGEAPALSELSRANARDLAAADDLAGGLWFRHLGLGVFHLAPDGVSENISTANGLPADRISCWMFGPEGNLWLGAKPGGLVRLRKKQIQVFDGDQGLANPAVSTLCEDFNGDVWLGTFGGGLYQLHQGNFKRFDLPNGINRGSFFSVYPDKTNRIWTSAGNETLYKLQDGRFSPSPAPVNEIQATLVDRQRRVWLGTKHGLACLTNGILEPFTAGKGIRNVAVRSLAQDSDGAIWIGTRFGDLYRFDGEKFIRFHATDALQKQPICALLAEADGTLWLGTFRGGLVRFKNGLFTRYTSRDGLPNDIISQILDDGSGKLWMGSHDGIFYVTKESLRQFDEGKLTSIPCVRFGQYDGLPTRECSSDNQPACWRGRDGTLWFATLNGAVAIRPEKLTCNPVPPPVVVEEVYLDGKLFADNLHPAADKTDARLGSAGTIAGLAADTPLLIPPGRHQIEFRYTALSYSSPDNVRFRYQLTGMGSRWVEAGTKRFADYDLSQPGSYRFRVNACNSDAVWNGQGASVSFRVRPFVWQTLWFQSVVGFMAFGFVVGVVRFVSTRRFKKQLAAAEHERVIERERERIATDIHDDLGAGLTRILLQCSLAQRDPQPDASGHISKISDTARDLVRAMDEIVWAVNPENDTLEGLVNYLGKFTHEYLSLAGIRCRLDLPPQLPAQNLSAEVRHHVFLAVKELLNNIVKHARATEVTLQLGLPPDGFTLVIQDDGRGLNARAEGSEASPQAGRIAGGNGLRNLEKRLRAIGASFSIGNAPEKGTRAELTFTLKK